MSKIKPIQLTPFAKKRRKFRFLRYAERTMDNILRVLWIIVVFIWIYHGASGIGR